MVDDNKERIERDEAGGHEIKTWRLLGGIRRRGK